MNAVPIGGKPVAPLCPIGELVFVDFIKFGFLPLLFLSLHLKFQFCF